MEPGGGPPAEALMGDFPASVRLALGSELLRLYLTSDRLIVAHIGKRGAGALATTSFFGRLSGAVEDLFRGSRESLKNRRMRVLTPQEILEADSDNFHINYDNIVKVELNETPALVSITVVTKEEKFQFNTSTPLDYLASLFNEAFRSRATVQVTRWKVGV